MASTNTVSILDGSTFVVSDRREDVDAGPDTPHGLVYRDTRFLSRWRLTMNGKPSSASSRTGDDLAVDPVLPDAIGEIELRNIPGRWGRAEAATREAARA